MTDTPCQVRPADASDAAAVAELASELAQSFTFARTRFDRSYPALLAADSACLLLAVNGDDRLGYLLGFEHLTFYANGPVAWVEEVLVRGQHRGGGVGRALMSGFEQWAAARDCALVALATRRQHPSTAPWDTKSPPSTIERSSSSQPSLRQGGFARRAGPRGGLRPSAGCSPRAGR